MTFVPGTAYADDWENTQDIVDAGFVYGPDRDVTSLPAAPSSGVKVRAGNPTQNQIAVAASSFGFRPTDQIFTIWANRLRETPANSASTAIIPVENDQLVVGGVTWIMKWVKTVQYGTQFVVYCARSPGTEY